MINSVHNNYNVVIVILFGDLASGSNYKQITIIRTRGLGKSILYIKLLNINKIDWIKRAFVSILKSIKSIKFYPLTSMFSCHFTKYLRVPG